MTQNVDKTALSAHESSSRGIAEPIPGYMTPDVGAAKKFKSSKGIALSSAVNAACGWFATNVAVEKGRPDMALGFGAIALASTLSTLRFGLAPTYFADANELWSEYAARVGVPMISLGFLRAHRFWPAYLDVDNTGFPFKLAMAVTTSAVVSRMPDISYGVQRAYEVLVGVASMGAILYAENLENTEAVAAVAAFSTAGLIIGPDAKRNIFGVRRINWYHYLMGASMVLFSQAILA